LPRAGYPDRETRVHTAPELPPGKGAVINHDAGNKAFFFAIAVGHGVFYLFTAACTVQKIDAVSQMPQQRQFKTTQRRFGRAGCASQRLDTVQIIEEKFREASLMFKNA
jgi:hypothetical protein